MNIKPHHVTRPLTIAAGLLVAGLLILDLTLWFVVPPPSAEARPLAAACGNVCGPSWDGSFGMIIGVCGGGGSHDCYGPCNCGLDQNGDGIPDLFCPGGSSCYFCCQSCPGGCGGPPPPTATPVPTATPTPIPSADLSVTKTDGRSTVAAGSTTTYTIAVSNSGPGAVTGARVQDTFPTQFLSPTWTCSASAGSGCAAASGSGNINTTVNLSVGGVATILAAGTVSSTATGSLINTVQVSAPAGVTDPNAANNSATDTDTITPQSDLAITKTDGLTIEVPGTAITYTIAVTNTGPSAVSGAVVSDTIPSALTGATWTCSATAGGSCGAASGSSSINTTVNLPPNGRATFILNGVISSTATGALTNTATVTNPAGNTDPDLSDNSATDIDTLSATANIVMTKSASGSIAVPGTAITYTVTLTNTGPSFATSARVTDTVSAQITGVTWTCSTTAGSSCNTASGSGNVVSTTVNLAVNGRATILITGTVNPTATGTVANSVVYTTTTFTDPDPTCTGCVITTTLTPRSDLSITKTDSSGNAVPGTPITYTLRASNAGPSASAGGLISDTIPAQIAGATWTCSATSSSSCGTASGSGNVNLLVNLAVGGQVTVTVSGTVRDNATGTLTNTATIQTESGNTDTDPPDNTATDTDTLVPTADLYVTKTNNQTSAVPGTPITYTIVVGNNGPSVSPGSLVADTLPADITGTTWTCIASAGSACGASSGAGDINTTVNLAVSGTVTFTVTGTISSTAGAGAGGAALSIAQGGVRPSGSHRLLSLVRVPLVDTHLITTTLTNSASVTVPVGIDDPDAGNNLSTVSNPLGPQADLVLTLADAPDPVNRGESIVYHLVVSNLGPSAAQNVILTNTLPSGVSQTQTNISTLGSISCSPSCALGVLDVAQSVNITITALVDQSASNPLIDRGLVLADTEDPHLENNSAAADTLVRLLPQGGTPTPTPTPAPTATPGSGGTPAPVVADPAISKSVNPPFAQPGEAITFTLTVHNPSAVSLTGVVVNDPLPAEVEYVSGNTSVGSLIYDQASHTVTIQVGTLAPYQTATVTLAAKVASSVQPPSQASNTATFHADGYPDQTALATVYIIPASFPITGDFGSTSPIGDLVLVLCMTFFGGWRSPHFKKITARNVAVLALFLVGALAIVGLSTTGGKSSSLVPTLTPIAPSRSTAKVIFTATPVNMQQTTATPEPTVAFGQRSLAAGEGVAHLLIPSIGVDQPVVTLPIVKGTWDVTPLKTNIGWLQSTGTKPGDGLAMVLAGHVTISAGEPGPFLHLATLAPGAEVIYRDGSSAYRYIVQEIRIVPPLDTQQLYLADGMSLLLTTCINWDAKLKAYRDRLLVRAALGQ